MSKLVIRYMPTKTIPFALAFLAPSLALAAGGPPPDDGTPPPSTPPPGPIPTEPLKPTPLPDGSFTPPTATSSASTDAGTGALPTQIAGHSTVAVATAGIVLVLIIGAIAYYALHHRKA